MPKEGIEEKMTDKEHIELTDKLKKIEDKLDLINRNLSVIAHNAGEIVLALQFIFGLIFTVAIVLYF